MAWRAKTFGKSAKRNFQKENVIHTATIKPLQVGSSYVPRRLTDLFGILAVRATDSEEDLTPVQLLIGQGHIFIVDQSMSVARSCLITY